MMKLLHLSQFRNAILHNGFILPHRPPPTFNLDNQQGVIFTCAVEPHVYEGCCPQHGEPVEVEPWMLEQVCDVWHICAPPANSLRAGSRFSTTTVVLVPGNHPDLPAGNMDTVAAVNLFLGMNLGLNNRLVTCHADRVLNRLQHIYHDSPTPQPHHLHVMLLLDRLPLRRLPQGQSPLRCTCGRPAATGCSSRRCGGCCRDALCDRHPFMDGEAALQQRCGCGRLASLACAGQQCFSCCRDSHGCSRHFGSAAGSASAGGGGGGIHGANSSGGAPGLNANSSGGGINGANTAPRAINAGSASTGGTNAAPPGPRPNGTAGSGGNTNSANAAPRNHSSGSATSSGMNGANAAAPGGPVVVTRSYMVIPTGSGAPAGPQHFPPNHRGRNQQQLPGPFLRQLQGSPPRPPPRPANGCPYQPRPPGPPAFGNGAFAPRPPLMRTCLHAPGMLGQRASHRDSSDAPPSHNSSSAPPSSQGVVLIGGLHFSSSYGSSPASARSGTTASSSSAAASSGVHTSTRSNTNANASTTGNSSSSSSATASSSSASASSSSASASSSTSASSLPLRQEVVDLVLHYTSSDLLRDQHSRAGFAGRMVALLLQDQRWQECEDAALAAALAAAGGAGQTGSAGCDGAGSAAKKGGPSAEEQLHQLSHCVVCLDAPRSVLLLPCKHLVLCRACYKQLQRHAKEGVTAPDAHGTPRVLCPMCRAPASQHMTDVIMS